ncbi:MAG: ABC transporter ATP-binding protein [Ruminococcaceae bacterium]|nr:ABC transporter ATP-binding protein [Oscillospiraceae bacterium]
MLKRFAVYYRSQMKLFIADLVCALLLAVCDLIYPMITRNMLNIYIPNNQIKLLLIWAVILLSIYLLKTALNYFVSYWGHLVGVAMQADMRRDVFAHLQKLPVTYFDNNKTGTIMSRIVSDLMDISELAHHGPEDIFISVITIIGAFIMMSSIYFPLAVIVVLALPIMVIFASKLRVKMGEAFTATRVEIGEINAGLENSIAGIRVAKAYTSGDYENRQFAKGNKKFVTARSKAYKVMAQFHSGTTFIGDFLQIVLYVAGGLFCAAGKIDIGDFTAFVLYIGVFMNPVRRLISFVEQYQNGMTGFRRFTEIMDYPAEEDAPDAAEMGRAKGEIEFKDVSFRYEEGKDVLRSLSFKLDAGKTLALVGPSGGGKTTICHLIPRFYDILEGSVTLDGCDIRRITLESLRQNIGMVAQDVFLFNATIYENICYGTPDATMEQVREAAERANILSYIESLPDGFNTIVGERGVKLSGGQKQRVAIARVFLKNPPILILDEATSALDNATELMIQQSLEELCKGRTTLVVAHRLTTIKNADEILVITDNGIEERGDHASLLAQNGIYAGLWNGMSQTR